MTRAAAKATSAHGSLQGGTTFTHLPHECLPSTYYMMSMFQHMGRWSCSFPLGADILGRREKPESSSRNKPEKCDKTSEY